MTSPELSAIERQAVLDAVRQTYAARQTIANPVLPLAAADNPLGFQPDAQGQIPTLEVNELEGEAQELRLNQCAAFCRFLDT